MSGAAQPAAGRRFELKVRKYLEENGYWVMKSPGSRGAVDMVALKRGQILFVQCKVDGRMDPKEWNALYSRAVNVGATPVMARRAAPGRIGWWLLTGAKWEDSGRRRQPMEPFIIDEAASAAV